MRSVKRSCLTQKVKSLATKHAPEDRNYLIYIQNTENLSFCVSFSAFM